MNTIFYTKKWEGTGERLQRLIQTLVPDEGTEIYRTSTSLSHRLRHPPDHSFVVVVMATGREELLEVLSLHSLLQGVRLILIVPDQEEETLRIAHRLRPRFLTYLENDFSELLRVLNKMAANFETFE